MDFEALKTNVDDMYLVLNDQALSDDFCTTLKWHELQEFVDDVFMIKELTILKLNVSSRDNYNEYLISYLKNMRKRSARDHFPAEQVVTIYDDDYDIDIQLVDALFNIHADGNKVDLQKGVITLTENLDMNNHVKHLVYNYGFSIKIIKDEK